MSAYSHAVAREIRNARRHGAAEYQRQCEILIEAMGLTESRTGRNDTGGMVYQQPSDAPRYNAGGRSLNPRDLSVRDLFVELVVDQAGNPMGQHLLESYSPRKSGRSSASFLEAGPVDHSAFSNVTGQIVFASILEGFQQPSFIGDQVCRTVPTDIQEAEKIPGISLPGDAAESIGENQPYPEVGLSEEWVMTPEKIKRGFIISLSKEAVLGDKTGLLLERANKAAEMLGINREKRILDAVLGISTLYARNGNTAQATYGNSHTNGDFDNLDASALQDWTDIEIAELLFDAITDPNTGEPVALSVKQLIVPTALLHTARHILQATELRNVTNTSITTLSPNDTQSYQILSNQYVKSRSGSATAWWLGDFRRGFTYRENWPITSEEQREGSHLQFQQDTVLRFKASEKGAAAVEEPRFAVQGNA